MKERFNTQIEKELPEALRNAVRQHPLKKIFQEEEARIRQSASSGNQPPVESAIGGARVVSMSRRLAAVAAVLLAVGFTGYVVWQEFFVAPPLAVELIILPDVSVTANEGAEENFKLGRDAFKQEKYGRAITFLKQVPNSVDYYYDAQFLLAHANHQLSEYAKAIPGYELFLKNGLALMPRLSGHYQREDLIRWNLVVACWGDGQTGRARAELDKLRHLPSIGDDIKQNIPKLENAL